MSDTQTTPGQSFSIAALAAGSQPLFPEAASGSFNRRDIFNNGNANIVVNLMGGSAVPGGVDTVTVVPNGSLTNVGLSNAITVSGTVGQPVTAIQR